MNIIKTKSLLITLFYIFSFSVKGQQLDIETKTEIYEFVKKETKYLHALKFKKYYKNFNDLGNFVIMFEGERINRNKRIKKSIRKLKKKKGNYSKLELAIMTPFEEFFNNFNLYIFTKEDLEQDSKKAVINKQLGMDITKNWNPKIEFTTKRYLICLLPKFDTSKSTVPKYGEFMILQILEKNGNKWKVYSSWN